MTPGSVPEWARELRRAEMTLSIDRDQEEERIRTWLRLSDELTRSCEHCGRELIPEEKGNICADCGNELNAI